MLTRNRVSRIYFDKKFFDYPISLKWETFKNMGFITTLQAGFSYLVSVLHKDRKIPWKIFISTGSAGNCIPCFLKSIRKICGDAVPGKSLLTGRPARQRPFCHGDSHGYVQENPPRREKGHVETSLIEEFSYPKLGPGELWDVTGEEIIKNGGQILRGCQVTKLHKDENNHITSPDLY